jgi:hypothetical protein
VALARRAAEDLAELAAGTDGERSANA